MLALSLQTAIIPEFHKPCDFVVGSCAFACGDVIIDTKSYIYHIRHQNSETSGGNGLIKRMQVEWKKTFVNVDCF